MGNEPNSLCGEEPVCDTLWLFGAEAWRQLCRMAM